MSTLGKYTCNGGLHPDIRIWMLQQRLMINDSKTEFMLLGTRQQLAKVSIDGIWVGTANIHPATSVKNLGVHQDPRLCMSIQVAAGSHKAFGQLYKLQRIGKYLANDAIQTLVYAFVTSNIDNCNSLCMPEYLVARLQRVQNAAARARQHM